MNSKKAAIGILAVVVLVGALYVVNRVWIEPLSTQRAEASTNHPFGPQFSLTGISGQKLSLADY